MSHSVKTYTLILSISLSRDIDRNVEIFRHNCNPTYQNIRSYNNFHVTKNISGEQRKIQPHNSDI